MAVTDELLEMEIGLGKVSVEKSDESPNEGDALDCYNIKLDGVSVVKGCIPDGANGTVTGGARLLCEVGTDSSQTQEHDQLTIAVINGDKVGELPDGCILSGPIAYAELQIGKALSANGQHDTAEIIRLPGDDSSPSYILSVSENTTMGKAHHNILAPLNTNIYTWCSLYIYNQRYNGALKVYATHSGSLRWWLYAFWGYPVNNNKNNIEVYNYNVIPYGGLHVLGGLEWLNGDLITQPDRVVYRSVPGIFDHEAPLGKRGSDGVIYITDRYETVFVFDRPGPDPGCYNYSDPSTPYDYWP